jgi:hypothetical protein
MVDYFLRKVFARIEEYWVNTKSLIIHHIYWREKYRRSKKGLNVHMRRGRIFKNRGWGNNVDRAGWLV